MLMRFQEVAVIFGKIRNLGLVGGGEELTAFELAFYK